MAQHSSRQSSTAHLLRAQSPELALGLQLLLVEGSPLSFPLQAALAGVQVSLQGVAVGREGSGLLLLLEQLLLQRLQL